MLLTGYVLIRRGRREAHRRAMLGAMACSTLFLVSYLAYHFQVGSVSFRGQGPIRTVYFAVLLSHTVLAVVIVPLVLITFTRAHQERATMTYADFCSALREDYSSPQSISVARHFPGPGAALPG